MEFYSPIVLDQGWDFLDQEPFVRELPRIVSATGLDPTDVKKAIVVVANVKSARRRLHINTQLWYQNPSQELCDELTRMDDPKGVYIASLGATCSQLSRKNIGLLLTEIGSSMYVYPHWVEYVATQIDDKNYTKSGKVRTKRDPFLYTETWASWIARRLDRTQRSKFKKVFPEYYNDPAYLNKPNVDDPNVALYWRILLCQRPITDGNLIRSQTSHIFV